MFIFFNSTFLPMFFLGLAGMPRRVFEYALNLQPLNVWASVSAYLLGGSMLIFLWNFIYSTLFARKRAAANPWDARGLEWQVSSPPPPENFAHIPVVLSGPYEYGDPNAPPVADLNPPVGVVSAAYAGAGLEA
jgi:cytochrome c oxidase subunit 1